MVQLAPAQFAQANMALPNPLDGLAMRTLQAVERVLLSTCTNVDEALVVTSARVIVLKGPGKTGTGQAVGRYFPLNSLISVRTHQGFFGGGYIAFMTADTSLEPLPFDKSHCTFAVSFRDSTLLNNVSKYLDSVMGAVLADKVSLIATGPMSPINAPPGLLPQPGEKFYYAENATLYAEHIYREYVGGNQGISFRILPGVYYRVGGTRGQSVNKSVTEADDVGVLALSNLRLAFIGNSKTLDISYRAIIGVTPFVDGFQLNLANKPPYRFQTGEGLGGFVLQRLITNPP